MSPPGPSRPNLQVPVGQYLQPNPTTPTRRRYSVGSAGSGGSCNQSPCTPLSESNLSQHNKEWEKRKLDNNHIEDCIRNEGMREYDHALCNAGVDPNELHSNLESLLRPYSAGRTSAQSPMSRHASITPTEDPFYVHCQRDMENLGLKSGRQEDRLKRKSLADAACGAMHPNKNMTEKELEHYRVKSKKMRHKEKSNETKYDTDDHDSNERMGKGA